MTTQPTGRWQSASKIPHAAGCYALYRRGILVYIGQAVDLCARIGNHRRKHSMATSGEWAIKIRVERFYGERATLELRLLRRLRPAMNRQALDYPVTPEFRSRSQRYLDRLRAI